MEALRNVTAVTLFPTLFLLFLLKQRPYVYKENTYIQGHFRD